MSLKPVWINLLSAADLVDLAAKHLTGQFAGYRAEGYSGLFGIMNEEGGQLILGKGGPLDDWDAAECARLQEWGLASFAHSIESRNPDITLEFISRLSEFGDLAIDNDVNAIIRAKDLFELAPEQQASFILGNEIRI